jgi:hypothetical protein
MPDLDIQQQQKIKGRYCVVNREQHGIPMPVVPKSVGNDAPPKYNAV